LSRQSRTELTAELAEELRAYHHAVAEIDEAACARLGVNHTDLRCLDVLDRGGPLSAGHLAAATGLTTGAVTALIDRLERAGYARRTRDTVDRRRVLVEITPEVRRLAQGIYGPLMDAYERDIRRYSQDELRLITGFVRGAREVNEEHAAKVRAASARDQEP
jgi:DNA-binding MarR family transcriptional regulator